MKNLAKTLAVVTVLTGSTFAHAAQESFHFYSASAGGVTADFTLDVINGLAVDGSGTLSSSAFSGNYDLTLLTAASVLQPGEGTINPTPGTPSYDLGSGFTWRGVPLAGGVDFIGDAVVKASPNYLDDFGLIFKLTNQSTHAAVGGLNIFSNTNTPSSLYATALSINGTNTFENSGNGVLTAVPEPSTWMLMFGGLSLLAFVGRRRKTN
jgi:hypothetical protein